MWIFHTLDWACFAILFFYYCCLSSMLGPFLVIQLALFLNNGRKVRAGKVMWFGEIYLATSDYIKTVCPGWGAVHPSGSRACSVSSWKKKKKIIPTCSLYRSWSCSCIVVLVAVRSVLIPGGVISWWFLIQSLSWCCLGPLYPCEGNDDVHNYLSFFVTHLISLWSGL